MLLDSAAPKQSTCELEADAVAADILNRMEVNGMWILLHIFSAGLMPSYLYMKDMAWHELCHVSLDA